MLATPYAGRCYGASLRAVGTRVGLAAVGPGGLAIGHGEVILSVVIVWSGYADSRGTLGYPLPEPVGLNSSWARSAFSELYVYQVSGSGEARLG